MKLRAQSSVHRYSTSSPISQLTLSSFLSDVRKSLLKGLNECLKRGVGGPSHPLFLPLSWRPQKVEEREDYDKVKLSLSLATHSFSPVVRLVLRDCVRKMALELHIQPFLFAVWEKSAKRAAQAAADERASEVAPPLLYFALSSSLSPQLG